MWSFILLELFKIYLSWKCFLVYLGSGVKTINDIPIFKKNDFSINLAKLLKLIKAFSILVFCKQLIWVSNIKDL